MTLFDQISEDIKSAMKARDKVHLETLRNIKKVFLDSNNSMSKNSDTIMAQSTVTSWDSVCVKISTKTLIY